MTWTLSHTLHVSHYLFANSHYSCFLSLLVIPPFSVILKTPTDSVLHLSTTMTSADFCVFSIALQPWLLLSEHSTQTSLGTTRFLLSIYLPHLSCTIPCSYWASTCSAALPSYMTSYVVSVRQTGGLPVDSSVPHIRLPSDFTSR